MLLQEAQITGQLEHPSIVPIHQITQDDAGNIEIIMKRLHGQTLLDLLSTVHLEDDFQLPVTYLQHLIQVCFALEYAHNQNIVHRDIKLENIMIGDFNEVFLMDWGLGMDTVNKIGAHPGIVGTPAYMAPEMLSGNPDDIDVRTDVYLMGGTIHHLLTGEPRHNKKTVRETLDDVQASVAYEYPPEIPSVFGDIINTACARGKSERFQSIRDLRQALENALEHWEAIQITQRAEQLLNQFTLNVENVQIDNIELSKQYLKIRTLWRVQLKFGQKTRTHVIYSINC